MWVQQLQRGSATISHAPLLVGQLPVSIFRVKFFFSMRVGALVSLGMFSYLWPGSYFSVFQTRDFPLSVLALLIFKQEAKDPCQGRQYRTRAVSASYSGPDCLGPSYFVGGFCPNIQVAICPSTSNIYFILYQSFEIALFIFINFIHLYLAVQVYSIYPY